MFHQNECKFMIHVSSGQMFPFMCELVRARLLLQMALKKVV